MSLKINNTRDAAVESGKWENPGAELYDKILEASGDDNSTESLLKEAYLIAHVKDIRNTSDERTSFSSSGCKYPHHVIRNGELVLSVPGVKAAYARSKQMGIYNGEVKKHLMRHFHELDMQSYIKESNDFSRMESNFQHIYEFINEDTGIDLTVPDYSPTITEATQLFDEAISIVTNQDRQISESFDMIERFIYDDQFRESVETDTAKNDNNNKEEKFVPIFGISKSYSLSETRNDGSKKNKAEIGSIATAKRIKMLSRGDNYSHSCVSFDLSLEKMYSFEGNGFVVDNMMERDSWMGTRSIYICVMFVKKSERDMMIKYVEKLKEHPEETQYSMGNLVKMFIGKPSKVDKRFICSSFTGYILQCANPKNLHRDYSRFRPEDITVLPRAFYLANVKDREEFIQRKSELNRKVKEIYKENIDEIRDYNNHLPKLMLKDKLTKLKTSDKILDWILGGLG